MSEGPSSQSSHRYSGSRHSHSARSIPTGLFAVLLMFVFILFAQSIQDTIRLNREQATLNNQIAQQRQMLSEAQKVRSQLEAIAGDTALLAEAGNQNAIRLRDFLAEQGVTISPPSE